MYKQSLTYYKFGQPDDDYEPESGCFALCKSIDKEGAKRISEWFDCRETFDNHFPSRSRQFMFYDDKKGENVAAFIEKVEKRLNVEPKTEIMGFHNVSNVCRVQLSKWWTANGARRQLFTILLRCGVEYTRNFNEALWSNEYTKDTRKAVERFFNGYTHFAGTLRGEDGWVRNFCEDEFMEDNSVCSWESDNSFDENDKIWQKQLSRLRKPIDKSEKA